MPSIRSDALNAEVMRYTCRASRCLPYVYFANAKCASSTIQTSVLQEECRRGFRSFFPEDGRNVVGYAYFRNDYGILKSIGTLFGFTFVRNPFSRALSVYLDKIATPKDAVAARFFRIFPDAAADLSFGQFLARLATLHPMQMDPHWRPQSYNIAYGFVSYGALGHVEQFDTTFAEAWEAIFASRADIARITRHETGAAMKLDQYYGEEEADLVRRIYCDDFSNFGYSDRVEDSAAVPSAPPQRQFSALAFQNYAEALEAKELGRHADAVAVIERLIRLIPHNPYLHETMAQCFAALGDAPGARREIEAAIEICPALPRFKDLRNRLGPTADRAASSAAP